MIRPPARPPEDFRAAAMTPCIDVIFNLLIFVLCTSQLRSQEAVVESRLPGEVQPRLRERPEPTLLRIGLRRQEGAIEISLDGRAVSRCAALLPRGGGRESVAAWDREADRALGGGFASAASAALSDPETEVLLTADAEVPYDLVARCEDRIRLSARGAPGRRARPDGVRIVYEWTATERPPVE